MQKGSRLLLLAPGAAALVAGMLGALMLLGLPSPVTAPRLPELHGPVLVLGFIGTVVALERAVAARTRWALLAPGLTGAAVVLMLSPAPRGAAHAALTAGMLTLLAVYGALWRRQPSGHLAVQVLGATAATAAAVLWAGGVDVPTLLPWLAGFVVLTIVGERLELARVGLPGPHVERRVLVLAVGLTASLVATTLWPAPGHVLLGVCVLGLVQQLLVHDVARRTVRSTGLPRYAALGMLAGYGWLGSAGVLWALTGPVTTGPAYDALVHAVFLGFTLSMIMVHAPIILPGVTGITLRYHPVLLAPLALLHGSLVLRVVGGDLHGQGWALQLGGALNIASVVLFVLLAAWSTTRTPAPARTPATAPAAPATHHQEVPA